MSFQESYGHHGLSLAPHFTLDFVAGTALLPAQGTIEPKTVIHAIDWLTEWLELHDDSFNVLLLVVSACPSHLSLRWVRFENDIQALGPCDLFTMHFASSEYESHRNHDFSRDAEGAHLVKKWQCNFRLTSRPSTLLSLNVLDDTGALEGHLADPGR